MERLFHISWASSDGPCEVEGRLVYGIVAGGTNVPALIWLANASALATASAGTAELTLP